MPGLAVPVELGAEFIHGRPRATFALLREAGVAAVDSTRTQRFLSRGKLVPIDAFAEAQRAMRDKSVLARQDLSFARFLEKQQRLPAITRRLALMMVQGFDAADPARISAREIAAEWGSGAIGASQLRPLGGYGPLLESLAGGGARLQLHTILREVRWSRGAVELDATVLGKPCRARAKRAVITLPLGVLQSNLVRFFPPLHEKQPALKKLASGPVIRVAMQFRSAFWEQACPGVAFFHSPAAAFPTFWTPLPLRAPLLTAWAGGPKAARLTGKPTPELVRLALATVESVFRKSVSDELAACCVQDWQADPYARGGYSYVTVGGQGARGALQRPLEKTLYFSGEATDTGAEAGTVAGALASGYRAARELVAS
jgi:monoamine oxidase